MKGRKAEMKKIANLLLLIIVLVFVLVACGEEQTQVQIESDTNYEDEAQLEVMVTMFAQYDFAQQVGGVYVNVSRLVAPGVDVHSFDPTPVDIIAINESDLFIYSGHVMEPWVSRILDSLETSDLAILDVSTGANFLPWYGNHHHEHNHDEESHDHHHEHDHGEESHDHHHEHDYGEESHDHHYEHDHDHHYDHDHSHDYDPHIWASPINAIVMVQNIQEYLASLMPENAEYFFANATALIAGLEELDQEFHELMETVERTTIYHAG